MEIQAYPIIEFIIIGIWLPLVLFNPSFLFALFYIIILSSMLGGGKIYLIFLKTASLIFGGILGGIIFGFHFSSESSWVTIYLAGFIVLITTLWIGYLSVKTGKMVVLARKNLKEQKALLEQELSEAADYVIKMLPAPIQEGTVQIEWKFTPSASLGGDAFGYHWLDKDNFVIYLLDVCGHGVGAALLSASVLNVLRSESLPKTNLKEPKQVLKALNVAFPSDDNNDMFFTFWYGVYNEHDRKLTYASAGHPPALLFTNEKEIIELKTGNTIIGGMPDVSYQQKKQTIDNGATLYIFSDGVYETERQDGSMLNFTEYVTLISSLNSDEHNSLNNLYKQTLQISQRETFEDDYTILKVLFN
jgi:sigma-B regulation protein RsbU (phosphoserine phosphatase)